MRESILSIFTVFTLCVSLLSPAAVTTAYAQEVSDMDSTNVENPSRDADNAILGEEIELEHWADDLKKNNTWTYEFTTDKSAMIYFNITSNEYLDANFEILLTETKSGKTVFGHNSYVSSDTDYYNSYAVDPGTYVMTFKNTCSYTMYYNFKLSYSRFYTVDDPLYRLSRDELTIYTGKTSQLIAEAIPEPATYESVTWSSDNPSVAAVDENGNVTAKAKGTATITATKNGKKMTCKVTVKWEPETGVVNTRTYTIKNGNSKNESKTLSFNGKTTITFTAKNTSPELDIWADDGLYVVFESDDYGSTYVREHVDPGKTFKKTFTVPAGKYRFYYDTGNGCNITIKSTVKPQLSSTSLKVGRGYKKSLSVVGVKNDGIWSSSNKSIATVTSKGVVKGKKNGTCYIKYTLKTGKVLKCKITVVNPVTYSTAYVSDTSIYNECGIKFTNYTNKKITYIELNIKQYDNKGSRVRSPYDWYYVNDTLPANSSKTWEFWVSDDAKKCSAYIKKVYFSDGTTWKP